MEDQQNDRWWIPQDGVRAIIALTATIGAVIVAAIQVWETKKLPEWFVGMVGPIIAFYFSTPKNSQ